jgi:hypothetical protein
MWKYTEFTTWIENGCDPEVGKTCTELDLSKQKLASLPDSIGNLINLQTFNCSYNKLTSLPKSIGNLINLQTFNCSINNLTSLPASLGNLINLRSFYCSINKLTSLPDSIGNLINLQTFYCYSNQLISLPASLGNLRQLTCFYYINNPIEYIPPNVRRLTQRIRNAQGVYNDAQSVHNSAIQKSITDSINRILSIHPVKKNVIPLILSDPVLTEQTKQSLIEYSESTDIHSLLNITFADLLVAVWNRIMISDYASEIKTVLNTEMADAECKCFTGRLSRLINCLNGFDDLVSITIADNEQIGTIITLVKDQLNPYNVEEHRRIVRERLTELEYATDVIELWIGYIE